VPGVSKHGCPEVYPEERPVLKQKAIDPVPVRSLMDSLPMTDGVSCHSSDEGTDEGADNPENSGGVFAGYAQHP